MVGISLPGIKTYILHNYPGVDPNTLRVRVAKALQECLENGLIRKPAESSSEQPAPTMLEKTGLGSFLKVHPHLQLIEATDNLLPRVRLVAFDFLLRHIAGVNGA